MRHRCCGYAVPDPIPDPGPERIRVSDRAIGREAAAIGKLAHGEPPLMALDTLLQTAVAVQPYVPAEAKRLYILARKHARKYPEVASEVQIRDAIAKAQRGKRTH